MAKIKVKRYVTVTKTVVKKASSGTKGKTENNQTSPCIATFGDVEFHVKTNDDGTLDILTPSDVGQEISSSWVEHAVIGQKFPKLEFLGANNRTFTMTVVVDRQFGQRPHSVIYKLNKYCEEGKVAELHFGNTKIARKWKIDSVSQAWDTIYHEGQLTRATLDITLGHYT